MKIKLLSLALLASQGIWASGYHLGTQAISAQSTSNASTGEAADASTIFYNPAGLTHIEGTTMTGVLSLLSPNIKYQDASATAANGAPVLGDKNGKITKSLKAVPHAYGSYQINDRVTAGLGVFIPYGSETSYDNASVLRYDTKATSLQSVIIQPTVAFKVNDQHSLGFGLMVQHTEAELKKDQDLSLLVNPNAAGTGKLDANIDIKGSDWGVGFNAGWMWNPSRDWQLGLSYRSHIKHKLSGKAKTTLPESLQGIPQINALLPAEQNASVDITTPESISAHAMHQLDPRWKLFGDVTWTRHSRFEELNIQFEGTGKEQIIPSRWKNTFKFALGAAYKWSDPLELRFGFAYDQSPSKDAKYRLTTLPDNDRTWLSLGGKYQFNKNLSMNAAYSYIMIKNSDINHSGPGLTTAKANYKNSAQYLGMQLNYRF